MRVLLIEDAVSLGLTTAELLRDSGHTVTLANAQHYDAVLLDLVLGLERGEDIFASQSCIAHGHPPIIILSAQPEYEIEAVAKRIGATRWLSKPARIGAINAALTAAVKA
jgi:DNA-binding response OmpR family regulator